MKIKEYRKLPVAIKAVRVTKESLPDIVKWINSQSKDRLAWLAQASKTTDELEALNIETLEGIMKVNYGDWIIRGIAGEFYPCRNDIFMATYEEVTL